MCIVCFIFRNAGYIAVRYSVVSSARELQCGDHISWPTEFGVLIHHAIVLASKGDTVVKVIHVTEQQKRQDGFLIYEVVEELIDLGNYIKMGNVWLYEYEPDKCYDPDEVIMRAKTKLGKFDYHAFENNCEHFARWCKNNENASVQADVAKLGVAIGSSIGMAVIGSLFQKLLGS